MNVGEVALHGRRAAAARVDAVVWNRAKPVWRRRWEPAEARMLGTVVPSATPLGFLTRDRADLVRESVPDEVRGIVEEARRWAGGQVSVLGYPPFELAGSWDGATDPIGGRSWPDRQGRLIDFRHGMPGDPKLIWELHRCQELPLLVLASFLEADEQLSADAARRMLAWLARHPPGRGIAWANTFEPGLRALSLAVAFDALRGSDHLDDAGRTAVLRGLWQHARWIEQGLSRHSSANNHLVGELMGLLAVGLLAPELAASEGWAAEASAEIAAQALLQVLPDGGGAEQSFAYEVFVLDMLLIAAALLDARGRAVPPAMTDALRRAGGALALLLDDDEPDPAFGDADDGRALRLDGRPDRDARGVAAGIAARLGESGARRVARDCDAYVPLLFGSEGLTRFAATVPDAPARSGVLPDAGIVVIRTGGLRALFDAGSLGYLSIAAHGHADALSVVVSAGPDELVTDPGTGSYLDPTRRSWFRGTPAHATVAVDERDQSEQGGAFLWTRHGDARLLSWDPARLGAVGEHDGYSGLGEGVAHRRAVVRLGSHALLVVDRLEAQGAHAAAQNWPFHPACQARLRGSDLVELSCRGVARLAIAFAATREASVVVDQDAWWSRRLEAWEPAARCRQLVAWEGVVHLGALFLETADVDSPALRLEIVDEGVAAHASFGGGEHAVTLRLGTAVPVIDPMP